MIKIILDLLNLPMCPKLITTMLTSGQLFFIIYSITFAIFGALGTHVPRF